MSGLLTVAAEAGSVRMFLICQDVTIGEGDSQLIKPSELAERFYFVVLQVYSIF
jgi:hypothetical protein